MSINNRFQDNLLASTALDPRQVPGLNNAVTEGPIPSGTTLDVIAKNVKVDLAQAPDSTSHARPNMLASISSFAENIKLALDAVAPGVPASVYGGLNKNVKKDFAEWQGMVATIALSNIYTGTGLKLSVDTVRLKAAANVAQKCILMEMDKNADYKAAVTRNPNTNLPQAGSLYYICQNGTPFAIYHPQVGLCAMKEYDSTIFDGVISWFRSDARDCHGGWQIIVDPLSGSSLLDDFCLSRIAWWADQNGLRTYATFLRGHMQNPNYALPNGLASPNPIPNSENINNSWPGRGAAFGTTMMFYQDHNGNACALPELFLDTMLITYIGKQENNRQIYITSQGEKEICFRNAPAELEAYAPVAPLRGSMVELLKSCTLETLDFEARMANKRLLEVTVKTQIRTAGGELFTVCKQYDDAHLRQGKLPYLMIWPYVSMPQGMNLWKQYYATWQDVSGAVTFLKNGNGDNISPLLELSFDFEKQGTTHEVYRPTAGNQYWPVCTGSSPFRYALVKGKRDSESEAETAGMIFVPVAKPFNGANGRTSFPITNNLVNLAIDFGTTSTVCAIQTPILQGGREIALPFLDYGRVITCENADAKRTLDVEHWLGNTSGGANWQWNTKLFSVAQLMNRRMDPTAPDRSLMNTVGDQEYYVDGRMFLVSGSAMSNYATSAQNTADPLLTQQIMNDMKFNQTLNTLNYHAASIYLAGVYMYAVLYLLHQKIYPLGNQFLDLRVSYPNPVTLDALKSSWNYAKQILSKIMAPSLTDAIDTLLQGGGKFYSEATATTAYQRRMGGPLAFVNQGLVSLDVGGGTTDISISNNLHPNEIGNLSVRYAGREVMVSSLIEYYRRFAPGSFFGRDASFEALWATGLKLDPSGTKNLLNQFATLCHCGDPQVPLVTLETLTYNSTLRMDVEMLLANGMTMGAAANVNSNNLLRQLITLKFLMILQVTAKTVRESIELWRDPTTEELSLVGNAMGINLSVSGTSAQLLQYVFDCSMNDLSLLQRNFTPRTTEEKKMADCLNLFNVIFYEAVKDKLPDGATTALHIYIDQDVKEKREVSFGMLQPNIASYVPLSGANAGGAGAPANAAGQANGIPTLSGIPTLGVAPTVQVNAANAAAQRQQAVANMKLNLSNYPQNKLEEYIYGVEGKTHGLQTYIQTYENIYFKDNAQQNRGLGDDIYAISCLFAKDPMNPQNLPWLGSFAQSRNAVANNRAQYMVEKEQKKYQDLLACMYLVEEIIDREMARRQH